MRNICLLLIGALAVAGCAHLERDQDPQSDAGLPPDRPPPDEVTDAGIEQYPDAQMPPDAPPPPPTCEPECECDSDCGPDDRCWNGKCYGRCWCDAQCDQGETCRWGLCKPGH